jgi:hypothetical protein
MRSLILLALTPALSGCVVGTVANAAVDLATLPVKVVSKSVDLATTSQAEADEKRGRELRKAEEQAGRDVRLAKKRRAAVCKEAEERGEPCPPPPSAD